MRFYLLAFLAIMLSASQTGAGPATGTLQGTVRDETGAVHRGAMIAVQHWDLVGRPLPRPVPIINPIVCTDSEGRFSIQLAPGLYDVFISFFGMSPFAKKVKIEAAKETTLDCELPFDPLTEWIE